VPLRGARCSSCAAPLFLDALDVSMMGVALPSIKEDLDMSTSSLQWVVSAYVLGYGGFLLLGGRAADLLGRRRVFLVALGVFVVASMLGGFANDGTLLIATRFVKGRQRRIHGAGGALDHHDDVRGGTGAQQGAVRLHATGATGFSLGLVFGGLLTEIGWRWVFFLPRTGRAGNAARRRPPRPEERAPRHTQAGDSTSQAR
jgi:MFS family permease